MKFWVLVPIYDAKLDEQSGDKEMERGCEKNWTAKYSTMKRTYKEVSGTNVS